MSTKLGICAVFRQHQFAGGAYSFIENLLRGFADLRRTLPSRDTFDLTVFVGSEGIPWSDEQFEFRSLPDHGGRWPVEARVGLWESRGFDGVLFPNTFTPPFIGARRAVTVIHDLQYRNLPEHWPLAKRAWMRTCHEVTLRRCDAVVAISEDVKSDILKHYGERWASRVRTIWNPVSLDRFRQPAEQNYTKGRPYILCAAVDRPAKNLSTLIRAFALVREKFPEYCLVMAGQLRSDDRTWRRRSESIESKLPSAEGLVQALGLSKDVVLTGFIPDAELGALYRGASLFVLPSLFEGFGMPAVEALALGTPTLVSDLPVLREVTLNGARYVANPLSEHEFADGIGDILRAGDSARPSPDFCRNIQERFAPATIAREYWAAMLGIGA
jgi:glycosyltransferase involved in cell wall biosynthesis